jgi:ribonuclease-3
LIPCAPAYFNLFFVKFLRRFYNYYLHPDRETARRLHNLLGFTPAYLQLFQLAFFHKSTFSNREYAISNNERLEFLGDAVLSTIVGEYLFKKYPNSDEGFLTKMRSKIVKRNSLDEIADKMGLDLFLVHFNQTRLSKSMLGNALEALVGAIYIEMGYEKTRDYVVKRILRRYLDIHELELYDDNFKSQLLEWCQKNGYQIDYKVLAKYKSEKRDKFKVAVYIDGRKLGSADDFNKKSAEQLASERAIAALGILTGGNGQRLLQEMPQSEEEEGTDEGTEL